MDGRRLVPARAIERTDDGRRSVWRTRRGRRAVCHGSGACCQDEDAMYGDKTKFRYDWAFDRWERQPWKFAPPPAATAAVSPSPSRPGTVERPTSPEGAASAAAAEAADAPADAASSAAGSATAAAAATGAADRESTMTTAAGATGVGGAEQSRSGAQTIGAARAVSRGGGRGGGRTHGQTAGGRGKSDASPPRSVAARRTPPSSSSSRLPAVAGAV